MALEKGKALSQQELLEKIRHYCAYQERSELQVRRKLKALGSVDKQIPELIAALKQEDYLNENRFVDQYIRSRASQKGWGPVKISQALKRETGRDYSSAISTDSEASARSMEKLEKEVLKKMEVLKHKKDLLMWEKLRFFCMQRGFDANTSYRLIDKLRLDFKG
jgi:regulatory protein